MLAGLYNSGLIAGISSTANEVHTFLYGGGRMTDIGGDYASPTGLNHWGMVIGSMSTEDNGLAPISIWKGRCGGWTII